MIRILRRAALAAPLVLATALPLAAQEPPPAPPPPGERIERLRLERLREALDLTGDQVATLERQMEQSREAARRARERMARAEEELRRALAAEPADETGLRRALEALESERDALHARQRAHREALAGSLSAEQRARLHLFNRRFDERLRELVHRRGGALRRPGPPGAGPRAPAFRDRRGAARGLSRDEQVERVRHQIEVLERRLRELEGEPR